MKSVLEDFVSWLIILTRCFSFFLFSYIKFGALPFFLCGLQIFKQECSLKVM